MKVLYPQSNHSYTIYLDASQCKARNSVTGRIDFANSNHHQVIQSAIDAIGGWGGVIQFRPGVYQLASTLSVRSKITLVGSGADTTILKASSDINVITGGSSDGQTVYFFTMRDIGIDGSKHLCSNNGYGVIGNFDHLLLENCRFANIKKSALRLCMWDWGSNLCYLNRIYNCIINDADEYGIWADWRMTDFHIARNIIGSGIANIRLGTNTGMVDSNHLNSSPEYNIYMPDGCEEINITNNILEHAKFSAFYFSVPAWESADKYHKMLFCNNRVRGWGWAQSGNYDGIVVIGRSNAMARGFVVSGNSFAHKESYLPRHLIRMEYCDRGCIVANDLSCANKSGDDVSLSNCSNMVVGYNT